MYYNLNLSSSVIWHCHEIFIISIKSNSNSGPYTENVNVLSLSIDLQVFPRSPGVDRLERDFLLDPLNSVRSLHSVLTVTFTGH